MANKFIENPTDPNAYILIFVPLKSALEVTCNGNKSLKNDLKEIADSHFRKNNTNILVILDGLDELSPEECINNQTIYKTIQQEFLDKYPNSKYIITTRLEVDFLKIYILQKILSDFFHLIKIKSDFFWLCSL